MRRFSIVALVSGVSLAALLTAGLATDPATAASRDPVLKCETATSVTQNAGRADGEGYRYGHSVQLTDTKLTPVSGGCTSDGKGDQFALISSGPQDRGWRCIYAAPNNSGPPISITATVVGCKIVKPR